MEDKKLKKLFKKHPYWAIQPFLDSRGVWHFPHNPVNPESLIGMKLGDAVSLLKEKDVHPIRCIRVGGSGTEDYCTGRYTLYYKKKGDTTSEKHTLFSSEPIDADSIVESCDIG